MPFAELNAAVVELRRSLRDFTGRDALGQIHIRPPARENDEASFMRLVNWSYVLLFEAGRVTVPFLLKLPGGTDHSRDRLQETRDIAHALRTWSSHNIGFSSDREAAISRRVSEWFLRRCGATEPKDEHGWSSCFNGLCGDVGSVVEHCQSALSAIVADDAERGTIEDLRRRVDRSWPAEKFDALVIEICTRLAVTVDVPRFRNQRLSRWREYLDTVPDADDPMRAVARLIERDIIDHTNDILPIDGEDVMNALGLNPGPRVGDALLLARELFRGGIRDADRLLDRLREDDEASRRRDNRDATEE